MPAEPWSRGLCQAPEVELLLDRSNCRYLSDAVVPPHQQPRNAPHIDSAACMRIYLLHGNVPGMQLE